MPIFFFAWSTKDAEGEARASLLVDHDTKAKAIEIATAHHGARPTGNRQFPPGVFACEVFFNDISEATDDELEELDASDVDVEAGDVIVSELLLPAEIALRVFEDECEDETIQAGGGGRPTGRAICMSECEDDHGAIVRCELESHGDKGHRGGGLAW
jgi:hypothetical protein